MRDLQTLTVDNGDAIRRLVSFRLAWIGVTRLDEIKDGLRNMLR